MTKIIKKETKNNILYYIQTDGTYNLCAIEINNKIFVLNNIEKFTKTNFVINKKVIDFRNYFRNIIETKLKEQLKIYINKNINNYDLYKRNSIIYFITQRNSNEKQTNEFYFDYKGTEIGQNIIKSYSYNGNNIKYNYNLETEILDVKKDNKKTSLINAFFNQNELDIILFKEQCKQGIVPKIVNELIKIENFILYKNQIKIILNNNLTCTLKRKNDKFYNISNIISCDLSNNKDLKIDKNCISSSTFYDISLYDIKAFQHGKTLLPIDKNNLKYEIEYIITKKIA